MSTTEIRFSGFGGQGVIFLAIATGKAASIHEGRNATMNQSFGPEARGSSCSAQLVISDEPIDYPYVRKPSILVSMSQDAYETFEGTIGQGALILIDEDLVKTNRVDGTPVLAVPATRVAEDLGKRICANMVMFGFFTAVTGLVKADSARLTIEDSVPPGSKDLNLEAFEAGYERGKKAHLWAAGPAQGRGAIDGGT